MKKNTNGFLLKTVAVRYKESLKPLEGNTQRGLPPGKPLRKLQLHTRSHFELMQEERAGSLLPLIQVKSKD